MPIISTTLRDRALELIARCDEPAKLRQWVKNGQRNGEVEVVRAAELRLYEVLPSADPGTFEHDVWRSIFALEGALTEEREKTIRLTRTRQKIGRVEELETVRSLVLSKKPSDGFNMLVERRMLELTFEAVALRHPDRFEDEVLDAARARLREAGVSS